ncbi:glycyl-radical enzyme activating protein [Amedibacterium intestinale]|uniref:glycyl-radical enzyme activating protein n=1 Tax=Amedibacterium intestinale TaxID=2583452 RepID=UPI000E4F5AB0|nr:glycyl-radical enzyme activating protein [Amedibacterium intestinale]RHO27959.1 glycyl-radical enzyme activating protein [Erysipelotrichaceae bacterium AM17-60]
MINITNIEKFATHDGPGIRTTVFLKGCPMHCPWCANPETQSIHSVFMYTASKCVACKACINHCHSKALSFVNGHMHYEQTKCILCRTCENVCMQDAISFNGENWKEEDVLEEILKDKDYYDASGGGVTFSGGEPFVQFSSLLHLLKMCKQKNISTAVETTGDVPFERIREAEPYLDLFLYDFKHLDNIRLKKVTAGNGKRIKANLTWLLKTCPDKVIVRIPIIPGFNFEEALLKKTFHYLQDLGVKKLHLLPYHTLGKPKYEKMGKLYTMETSMMKEEELSSYRLYAQDLGFDVEIGG